MKNLIIGILVGITLVGCSTPRTKWTDKNMRVMIDPDTIDRENYVRIQQSLVSSDRWTVVARSLDLKAVKKEQERLHKDKEKRYDDKQKWAEWGKLYGVASIVVAHTTCQKEKGWGGYSYYQRCEQFLSLIDANTGIIITSVKGHSDGENARRDLASTPPAPSWDEVVEELYEAYPRDFRTKQEVKRQRDLEEEK